MILKGQYFHGDVTVDYYIDASEGQPMKGPTMDGPGSPPEDPDINSMDLMIGKEDFDPSDIYVASRTRQVNGEWTVKYHALADLIFEAALCEER
jgi:hypothetical protein